MQLKIFKYQEHKPYKLGKEGRAILENTLSHYSKERIAVEVPMQVGDESQETKKIKYRVSGIICHKGMTNNKGHYVTLLFPKGKDPVVCDDHWRLPIEQGCICYGQPGKSYGDALTDEGFSGYIYSLELDQ